MADPFDPTYSSLLAQWLDPASTPSAFAQLGLTQPAQPSALALAATLNTPQPPCTGSSVLDALIACTPLPPSPFLGNGLTGTSNSLLGSFIAEAGKPKRVDRPKRRVFFSFHYQNDINRVNVVRNSWRFRAEDEVQPVEWFDHSIWEEAKRTSPAALKRLIHNGMQNSSVTCVLAGAATWGRPWVRYEIVYALARGNGLLTVYIDGVNCMKNGAGTRGPNPLDHIGLKWGEREDNAYIWEKFGGVWRRYGQYTDAVTWPKWLKNVSERKFVMPLSAGALAYDYTKQNGYQNLSGWAQVAADQAGR